MRSGGEVPGYPKLVGKSRDTADLGLAMRSGGEVPGYLGKSQDIPGQERQVGRQY